MDKAYSTMVEGMTCGNCALTISKTLEKKGAMHVSANAASGEVNFTVVADADVAKMYDAIDALGYHVMRENADGEMEQSHHHPTFRPALLILNLILTVILLAHMFVSWNVLQMPWVQFALATPVFFIGWYLFGKGAINSVKNGMPNMNVLILLGATAAYIYSLTGLLFFTEHAHKYLFFETGAAIITLVMIGNWMEARTTKATTAAIDELVKLQPRAAKIIMTDSLGKETIIETESKYVRMDDIVLINHGDSIPVDGEVVWGNAEIDEHIITGESVPANKTVGDKAIAGTLVADGNIKVRATAVGASSVLSHIIKMVREAQAIKTPLQKLADKISAIFVPIVLVIAIITFFVNFYAVDVAMSASIMRAIAVLVIACPCAMGLATPTAIAVGMGRGARNGILIKGSDTLERLKKIKQIVFDKTGTLTTGALQIQSFKAVSIDYEQFRAVVASLSQYSSHPISRSIAEQLKDAAPAPLKEVKELKGHGMQGIDEEGNVWQLGSGKWLHEAATDDKDWDLYLYEDGQYRGALRISDTVRADAKETIATLQSMGYKTIMLSGDKKEKCAQVATELNITEWYGEQTPEQKNKMLDELSAIAPTAMVGDGINDAPALAKASVGISLSDSSQIAMQSANIILSNNRLSTLPMALRLGIYTGQTIKQNLFWAFFYNVVAIPFAAAGYLSPIIGAAAMALSDVFLLLNSLRLRVRKIG